MTDNEGEVVASYLVRVTLRDAGQGTALIPTNQHMAELVKDAIQTDSLLNGQGDYTVIATVSSERLDK